MKDDLLLQTVILYTISYRRYKKFLFKEMFLNHLLVFCIFLIFCYSLWIHSSWWVIAIIAAIILSLLYCISFITNTPKELMQRSMLSKKGIERLDTFLKNAPSGTFKSDEVHEFYNLLDENELTK